MEERIERALAKDHVIEITTIGRKTKKQRRIEIWFHNVDGRIFITGSPGRRSWYANMLANPKFTFHLKGSMKADLAAEAKPIVDEASRREVFTKILQSHCDFRNLLSASENMNEGVRRKKEKSSIERICIRPSLHKCSAWQGEMPHPRVRGNATALRSSTMTNEGLDHVGNDLDLLFRFLRGDLAVDHEVA